MVMGRERVLVVLIVVLLLMTALGCHRYSVVPVTGSDQEIAVTTSGPELVIRFAGLVSYVEQSTGEKWIFMPNASDGLDIGAPDVFHTAHEPRLLVVKGTPIGGGWSYVKRCDSHLSAQHSLQGRQLSGKHVTIESGIQLVSLNPLSTLSYLPKMDDLVKMIANHGGTSLGSIPASMFNSTYTGDQLLARFRLDHGSIGVEYKWDDMGTVTFEFETTKGVNLGNQRELGADIVLRVPLMSTTSMVQIGLADLGSPGTPEILKVDADGGRIELIVENAPVTKDGKKNCHGADKHFAGHYFLRAGYGQASWVVIPKTSSHATGVGSTNDNPQCSPVRDGQ